MPNRGNPAKISVVNARVKERGINVVKNARATISG